MRNTPISAYSSDKALGRESIGFSFRSVPLFPLTTLILYHTFKEKSIGFLLLLCFAQKIIYRGELIVQLAQMRPGADFGVGIRAKNSP
jgi:hypothetical protein